MMEGRNLMTAADKTQIKLNTHIPRTILLGNVLITTEMSIGASNTSVTKSSGRPSRFPDSQTEKSQIPETLMETISSNTVILNEKTKAFLSGSNI